MGSLAIDRIVRIVWIFVCSDRFNNSAFVIGIRGYTC